MRQWLRCIHGVDLTGSCSGPVRVVGSARCAWSDMEASPHQDAPIIGVKNAGLFLRGSAHWCGLHPEQFVALLPAARHFLGQNLPHTHSWKRTRPGVDTTWFGDVPPDFSGCFAVMLALTLGYSPVIVCGVPMDGRGHFYDPPYIAGKNFLATNDSWYALAREHAHEVFPMSGWTRDLFDRMREHG